MFIKFIEIQNFRKLKSVRIDLSTKTTVLVGANNSGKTSAMVALSSFLIDKTSFNTNDFTLSNWSALNKIGQRWESTGLLPEWESKELMEWIPTLPSLDVWLSASGHELYQVMHLLPSLSWTGGLVGVRLRLQPKSIPDLYKEYINARSEADKTIAEAQKLKNKALTEGQAETSYLVSLWPKNMCEFLEKKLHLFEIAAYKLDPASLNNPDNGVAIAQSLPEDSVAMTEDPFRYLIRIDKIDAHRGFSNLNSKGGETSEDENVRIEKGKLSDQLRSYYKKHIDPSKMPDATDVDALEAIFHAQAQFDEKLKIGFKSKFEELEKLGYPGITDPRLELSTKLKPVDGLNHPSALKFIVSKSEKTEFSVTLPEHYNGLGYQNLISIVFKLMSFRDDWMQVGKAGKQVTTLSNQDPIKPLHLVLVEEPEAHLHVQVQQVFIRKAYEILRKHDMLGESNILSTQLIVSTHSSHIAHECDFEQLRYFRRRPACENQVPTSNVLNLSEVFGDGDETSRFVSRYIKSTHCDLFFADAAILVEGSSERILLPHFIKEKYEELHHSYISLLEIGGSHAFRFQKLLDHLGLVTLIISDLDSASPEGHHTAHEPVRKKALITNNNTLKSWVPKKTLVDDLLELKEEDKILMGDKFYFVRVAYQTPILLALKEGDKLEEVLPSTFEDSFVYSNIKLLKDLKCDGLLAKCKAAINNAKSVKELNTEVYQLIRTYDRLKAEFALDLLFVEDPKLLEVPVYIAEGLKWLSGKVILKQLEAEQVIAETIKEVVNAA